MKRRQARPQARRARQDDCEDGPDWIDPHQAIGLLWAFLGFLTALVLMAVILAAIAP